MSRSSVPVSFTFKLLMLCLNCCFSFSTTLPLILEMIIPSGTLCNYVANVWIIPKYLVSVYNANGIFFPQYKMMQSFDASQYCIVDVVPRPMALCSTSSDACNIDGARSSTIFTDKLSTVGPMWETNASDEMCQVGDDFVVDGVVRPDSPLMFDNVDKVLFYIPCVNFKVHGPMFHYFVYYHTYLLHWFSYIHFWISFCFIQITDCTSNSNRCYMYLSDFNYNRFFQFLLHFSMKTFYMDVLTLHSSASLIVIVSIVESIVIYYNQATKYIMACCHLSWPFLKLAQKFPNINDFLLPKRGTCFNILLSPSLTYQFELQLLNPLIPFLLFVKLVTIKNSICAQSTFPEQAEEILQLTCSFCFNLLCYDYSRVIIPFLNLMIGHANSMKVQYKGKSSWTTLVTWLMVLPAALKHL